MKLSKGKNLNITFTGAAVFVVIVALFVIFSLRGMINIYRLRTEQQKIKKDIGQIKKGNKKIEAQIDELANNKQYIAEMAREKLNMIKKGEIVFKFIGGNEAASAKAEKTGNAEPRAKKQ